MITNNFEDFPDHRVKFFKLLRTINNHCFPGLWDTCSLDLIFWMHLIAFLEMKEESFSLIIDSIVWAFKHTMKDVAESGLLIMLELWKSALLLYFAFFASLILSFRNVSNSSSDFAGMFVRRFYLPVLSDVLFVLTDRMHKCGKCDIFLFSSSAFTLWNVEFFKDSNCSVKFCRRWLASLKVALFKSPSSIPRSIQWSCYLLFEIFCSSFYSRAQRIKHFCDNIWTI